MDLNKLGWFAAYAAPIALATAFWSQIRGWLDRVRSLLIVTITYDTDGSRAMTSYVWTHFKKVPFGYGAFSASNQFVRPTERHQLIGYEVSGESLTFRSGWRWLTIVKESKDQSSGFAPGVTQSGTLRVSFIRGMFQPDDLFLKAIDHFNSTVQTTDVQSTKRNRYVFNKRFGNRGFSNEKSYDDQPVAHGGHSVAPTDLLGARILRWRHDDLGPMIAEDPFSNLSYPETVLSFRKDLNHWMKSEKWYKEKGLPWQLNAKFDGPPGTGKTSLVRALGQEFDLPIEMFDLPSMSNQELTRHWKSALNRTPCIILFEDLDRIFDKDQNLITATNEMNPGITLDCLLNCISGVEEANGLIVIATVNDAKKLDAALTRPGRLDRTVKFEGLRPHLRRKIARRILRDWPHLIEQAVKDGDDETGAQFTKRCGDIAIEQYWRDHEQRQYDLESAQTEEQSAREANPHGVAGDQYQANRFT